MKPKLIILDRDGVINYDSDGYVKSIEDWHPIPGSLESIVKLNNANILVGVATNQSGLGRGLYKLNNLEEIHSYMKKCLSKLGGHTDYITYCPHSPEAHCNCRKPKPAMLIEIANKLNVYLNNEVIFIGDKYTDLKAADNANCTGILVKTGKGLKTLKQYPQIYNNYAVYNDLAAVIKDII